MSLTVPPAGVHLFLKGPSQVTTTTCTSVDLPYGYPPKLGPGQYENFVVDVAVGPACGGDTFIGETGPTITLLIAGGAAWFEGRKPLAANGTHHSAKAPHIKDTAGRASTTQVKTFPLAFLFVNGDGDVVHSVSAPLLSTSWEPFTVQVLSITSGNNPANALDGEVAGVYGTVNTEPPPSCGNHQHSTGACL